MLLLSHEFVLILFLYQYNRYAHKGDLHNILVGAGKLEEDGACRITRKSKAATIPNIEGSSAKATFAHLPVLLLLSSWLLCRDHRAPSQTDWNPLFQTIHVVKTLGPVLQEVVRFLVGEVVAALCAIHDIGNLPCNVPGRAAKV